MPQTGLSHTREVPVVQVGQCLAFQHLIAPIANVLENEEPQHSDHT